CARLGIREECLLNNDLVLRNLIKNVDSRHFMSPRSIEHDGPQMAALGQRLTDSWITRQTQNTVVHASSVRAHLSLASSTSAITSADSTTDRIYFDPS